MSQTENGSPMVSVIVPNYNYARYLDERIESILNQTYQNFELILLDDASTDKSVEVFEKYRSNPKVSHIVVNPKNSGSPFAQWEKGMRMAKGKYIWIAEADDSATPDFLEKCMEVAEAHPEVALIKPMSYLVDSGGNPSDHPPFEDYEADGTVRIQDGNRIVSEHMLDHNCFYNASMMLFEARKWRELKDLSFMHFRYTGDWLFWGLLALDEKVAEIRTPLNKFRLHGKSVTDEGHARQTGIKVRAEALALKWILSSELRLRGEKPSTIPLYQLHRDIVKRHNEPLEMELSRLVPDLVNDIRHMPKLKYARLWLKKHLGIK